MEVKYPHRVTMALTDQLLQSIKQNLAFRHVLEDLHGDTDVLLLQIVNYIETGETDTMFLRSVEET